MQSMCLMQWLTTRCIKFWDTGHPLELKRLPPSNEISEDDLIVGDKALDTKNAWFIGSPTMLSSNKLFCVAAALSLLPAADAQPTFPTSGLTIEPHDLLLIMLTIMVSIHYYDYITHCYQFELDYTYLDVYAHDQCDGKHYSKFYCAS
eukprot:s190_g29.t1